MSMNEVYAPKAMPRGVVLNVGNTTTKSGDPVHVGAFVGVAETASDGGVGAGGYTGLYSQTTGVSVSGLQPNFCSVAIDGVFKLPVVTAAAAAAGDWVYITNTNTLTTVAGTNTKFGILFEPIAGIVVAPGAAVMVKLIAFVTT